MAKDQSALLGLRLRRAAVALVAWASIALDVHGAPFEYFSYFTILTNLAIGAWFAWGAVTPDRAARAGALRLAVTVYGLVTVVVYWVLLSPTHHPQGWSFVANLGLHVVAPLAMAGEGLLAPWDKRGRGQVVATLAFPVVYCVFSLIRGAVTGWYPYFFLNPQELGGALPLTGYVGVLLVVFLLAAWGWQSLVTAVYRAGRTKAAAQ